MQRPIRAQAGVGPLEHPVRGVIGQRTVRSAQCPPQRLGPAKRHLAVQLLLIQAQPHERVRRRGKLLYRAGTLTHHGDQLLAWVDIALANPQQL